MSLTIGDRPLSSRPRGTVNYHIDGPAHRLLFEPFPRRVRAVFGGATVLDTTSGMLLHESNLGPQLYLPRDDVRGDYSPAPSTARTARSRAMPATGRSR